MDEQALAEAVTGDPGSITLGDITLLVGQPTDADFVTLKKHLDRLRRERAGTQSATFAANLKGLPPAVQNEAVKAFVPLNQALPTAEEAGSLLFEPAGAAFLLWLLCRKQHSSLTLEAAKSFVTEDRRRPGARRPVTGMRLADRRSRA